VLVHAGVDERLHRRALRSGVIPRGPLPPCLRAAYSGRIIG
jgi:hypothetical protein